MYKRQAFDPYDDGVIEVVEMPAMVVAVAVPEIARETVDVPDESAAVPDEAPETSEAPETAEAPATPETPEAPEL